MTHPASFIASVTFPIASSIMSTMPAWVRLALLLIPRYFCSYFRSTLNGPCTLWNGRYKNKGLDALCDRITLLACCSIEKETQVINWFGNVLLTWFSLIFWSWQDGFVKLLLSVSWVNKLLSSFYVKYFCHRDSSPSIFWSPKLAQKERTSLSRFFFYIQLLRETVVGKNVLATIPKGNMGYVQYTVPDTVAVEPTFVAFL